VGAVGGGEGALACGGEAQINVEIAAGVVATGRRCDVVIIDIGRIAGAAGQVGELPGGGDRTAVDGEVHLIGWQVIDGVQHQVSGAHVEAVVGRDGGYGLDRVVFQQADGLDLGSAGIRQRRHELEPVHVHAPRRQDIEVDVVEAFAERGDGPVDDIADVGIGCDEAAVYRVGLVLGEPVFDDLRDRVLVDVVVLPDVTFGVQDCDFPIKVVAWLVVLDVDDLAAGTVEDISAVRRHDVEPVVEVRLAGARVVVLVRLDGMAEGEGDIKRPGVGGVRGGRAFRGLERLSGFPVWQGQWVTGSEVRIGSLVLVLNVLQHLRFFRAQIRRERSLGEIVCGRSGGGDSKDEGENDDECE